MLHARVVRRAFVVGLLIAELTSVRGACAEADSSRESVQASARRAAEFYRGRVASHGGYVYYYSVDLRQRWGEGPATADQIWVQPPGTPTVGMAYLKLYRATGDRFYLECATAAAEALVYGQLKSGGWTNSIDFDPHGRVAQYRNGKGRGKNNSSLDDGQSQSAIRLLVQVDEALRFQHATIHEAAMFALDSLLAAQFPNGAFPQVWTGPVQSQPVKRASFPEYDWRTEHRVKNYWDMYTLNDNVCGYVAAALQDAARVYGDERYERALRKLGDFLLFAQLPEPQPAWAQQYNYDMKPIWARKFEPPAVAGDESQEVLMTLINISAATGETKYLAPIPRTVDYLQRSKLAGDRLARFYELQTNRPLYMKRRGDLYQLTYDDSRLPSHYGWKIASRLDEIGRAFRRVQRGEALRPAVVPAELQDEVTRIVRSLDEQGRWIDTYSGQRLVGQPKFREAERYISSATFSRNMELLADYLQK